MDFLCLSLFFGFGFYRFVYIPIFMPPPLFSMKWFEVNDPFYDDDEEFIVYSIEHDRFEEITQGTRRKLRLADLAPEVGATVVLQSKKRDIAITVKVTAVAVADNIGLRKTFTVNFTYE